jgi:hypothetical protein
MIDWQRALLDSLLYYNSSEHIEYPIRNLLYFEFSFSRSKVLTSNLSMFSLFIRSNEMHSLYI